LGKSFEGFIKESGGLIPCREVYAKAYRGLTAHQTYDTLTPKYSIQFCELVAEVMHFDNIIPLETIHPTSLPYALVQEGTWWKRVVVDYEVVPKFG
jgi:hypothetical protein